MKPKQEKNTCEEKIRVNCAWSPTFVPCGKRASIQHNGSWYCKTHAKKNGWVDPALAGKVLYAISDPFGDEEYRLLELPIVEENAKTIKVKTEDRTIPFGYAETISLDHPGIARTPSAAWLFALNKTRESILALSQRIERLQVEEQKLVDGMITQEKKNNATTIPEA